jgi:NAD-dependent deacetylase
MIDLPDSFLTSLRSAKYIAVLTGAGISAESGVPTFREAQTGLWAKYDPHELATPEAFKRNPKLVWEWYAWRRELVSKAQPNAGHRALAEIESRVPHFTLITQNVDGLHQHAGSKNVIELHGNINRIKCSREDVRIDSWTETDQVPPPCPRCGSDLRPDVVWFGESLPPQALAAAVEAAGACDVFFSIGTSGVVEPAASLPRVARDHGAVLIEINPEATPLTSRATYSLRGASGQILPELMPAVFTV